MAFGDGYSFSPYSGHRSYTSQFANSFAGKSGGGINPFLGATILQGVSGLFGSLGAGGRQRRQYEYQNRLLGRNIANQRFMQGQRFDFTGGQNNLNRAQDLSFFNRRSGERAEVRGDIRGQRSFFRGQLGQGGISAGDQRRFVADEMAAFQPSFLRGANSLARTLNLNSPAAQRSMLGSMFQAETRSRRGIADRSLQQRFGQDQNLYGLIGSLTGSQPA